MNLPIYLDHAATTPVDPAVVEAMLPYLTEFYGNPSALHVVGMAAREAVEEARETIADALNAGPDEIIFTSGGTESDNLAIKGAAEANIARGRHILTSPTEHHAVLEPCEVLAHRGWDVELLPIDRTGRVSPDDIAARIRPDTVLVSIMHANNEIGTIQPIAEIGSLCRERGVLFHTDAVQTFGKLPIDVRAMKIDLLSLTAHKFYGPKGIGALYVRRGTSLARQSDGGDQEKARRGGTLNVPGIVSLGKSTELAVVSMQGEAERLRGLRDDFLARLCEAVSGIHICGHRQHRLPNNIHFCVEGVDGEPMLLALDAAGICVSAGSACSAGAVEPSHVLKAIGLPRSLARGAVRMTLGRATTPEMLDFTLETLVRTIAGLRGLSRPVSVDRECALV